MKFRLILTALCAALAAGAGDEAFPSGGWSVDFRDNTSVAAETFGPNLLKNADFGKWYGTPEKPENWGIGFTPRQSGSFQRAGDAVALTLAENNRHSAVVQELAAPAGEKACTLELSFHYRGTAQKIIGALHALDAAGKELKLRAKAFTAVPEARWKSGRAIFEIPAECRSLRVALRAYGPGTAEFAKTSLRVVYSDRPAAEAVLFPFAYLDNLFCIDSGSIGQMNFLIRHADGKPRPGGELILELPDEVELLDAARPARIGGDGKTIAVAGDSVAVMIRAKKLAPGKEAAFRYRYREPGFEGEYRTALLRGTKPVKSVQPKEFRSGVMAPRIMEFNEAKVLEAWSAQLKNAGFNSVCHGMTGASRQSGALSKPVSAAGCAIYHRDGIEVTAHSGALSNGYRFGGGPVPPEILFQGKEGPLKEGRYDLICPEAILAEHPFVMAILKRHRELLKTTGMDAFEPNWEPFIFDRKGCFCERCLAAFEQATGLSRDKASDASPEWRRFRSAQHGRILRLVVRELGGGAFIPTIDAKELNGVNPDFYALSSYRDYAGVLERMVLWSPYIHYRVFSAYSYKPDLLEEVDAAAKAVRVPEKHYAYPNAVQVTTWVTEPETLAFQYLIYFFNRWQGASAYCWPGGLDSRWLHALARTNRIIAKLEKPLASARSLPPEKITATTPLPDAKLLKSYCFALPDGSRIVAVGNFWPRGEAFFKLPALKPGEAALDMLLNRRHDAAEGQVGGLCFRVYLIVQESRLANDGNPITEKEMKELKAARLPGIQTAMAWEKAWAERDLVSGNITERSIRSGQSQAELKEGVLKALLPWGNITISAERGGRIESLVFGKREVLGPGAVTGFAHLGHRRGHLAVSKRFFCTRLEYRDGALEADFTRKLQNDEHPQFLGLVLIVRWRMMLDKPEVRYSLELRNEGDGVRGPLAPMQKYFFLPGSYRIGNALLTRQSPETAFVPAPDGVVSCDDAGAALCRLDWTEAPAKVNFWNASGAARPCVELLEPDREIAPGKSWKFEYVIRPQQP